MTIHLVGVHVGCVRYRYFDSVWVNSQNANERAKQLRSEFRRNGFELCGAGEITNAIGSAWAVNVITAECLDGQIKEDKPALDLPALPQESAVRREAS